MTGVNKFEKYQTRSAVKNATTGTDATAAARRVTNIPLQKQTSSTDENDRAGTAARIAEAGGNADTVAGYGAPGITTDTDSTRHERNGETPTETMSRLAMSEDTLVSTPQRTIYAQSHTSRQSRRSDIEARRARAEYEAELELARLKEGVIKKKLALEMAELAADEDEEQDEVGCSVRSGPAGRTEQWVQNTTARALPPAPESCLSREAARAPSPPIRDQPRSDIEKLAEAISGLARSRPRYVYDLPKFNGNPAEWLGFSQAYRSTAQDLQVHENMARLRISLLGDAKAAVEELLNTATDPDKIMTALEMQFGHPNLLLECALRKINQLPKVSETGKEIQSISNTVRNCTATLKNIKANGYLNNPQLFKSIIAKLTPYQQAEYGRFAVRIEKERGYNLSISPSLEVLSEFLNELARESIHYCNMSFEFRANNTGKGRGNASLSPPHRNTARCNGLTPSARATATHGLFTQVETNFPPTTITTSSPAVQQCPQCLICKGNHRLTECGNFRNLSIEERWDFVKKNKLCFRCIHKTHAKRYCKSKPCNICKWSHHTLLHSETNGDSSSKLQVTEESDPHRVKMGGAGGVVNASLSATSPSTSARHAVNYETVTNVGQCGARALLKVIPVRISTSDGAECSTFALLDDGASVSLIDEQFAKSVCAKGPLSPLHLLTARGHCVSDNSSRSVKITVTGPNSVRHADVVVRTMRDLDLPVQTIPAGVLRDNGHLRQLPLGLDYGEEVEARPLLLLGQDNWRLVVGTEIRQGKSGRPVASLTSLGWVLHGPLRTYSGNCNNSELLHCMSVPCPDLHELVKSQFELESLGISAVNRVNPSDERAIRILNSTSRRMSDGWEVGLLWRNDNVEMPDNYNYAFKRLKSIERKMDKNNEFSTAYCAQVERLVNLGYASKLDKVGFKACPVWYLPHFGVTNPNKPGKLRLVFDAAATCEGVCLNDNLLSGPDLLNSLLSVLFKFRLGKIAFTADIADMFMRVKIREADRGAQLFLWRGRDRNRDPDIYVMNSMIFGAASSPTSAIYILNKNASQFQKSYPEAVNAIHNNHYVDDYLDSVSTVSTARQRIKDVSMIHTAGGFEIRGWVTNSPELRRELPDVVVPGTVTLDKSPHKGERTLGMIWIPELDELGFDLSFKRSSPDIIHGKVIPTKREFLRFIMSIYDPLGILCPFTIKSRVLMQKVWKSNVGWDDRLKEEETREWRKWLKDIESLSAMRVPRWYGVTAGYDLHVFGDASELAYSSVAYIVGMNNIGNRVCAMVAGKARVAPTKVVSIPRLELQAAVLTCRLAATVRKDIGITINKTYLWTDSKTVLLWINSDAREYQKYVSHRLAEIDNLSNREDWRWVPSECNPADEATRLNWPNNKGMWLSGPPFLCDPQVPWPACSCEEPAPEDPERLERVLVATETRSPLIDVTRYSTWTRAVRVTARVLTFVAACQAKKRMAPGAEELREAEAFLLRDAQSRDFAVELSAMRAGLPLPKSSRLLRLDPMLYEDGLLRVRGRLSASPELAFDEKHPVILDGNSHTTRLLVHHYHRRALHANHETVVNNLRERFWVTRIRPTVKAVVARCQHCRVQRARPTPPKMGDLPSVRLATTRRGFVHCGLDYFGPMEVSIGRRREKRWGVLFTCLATRAVHLELAASLSSDSAILALRRLIARRGRPAIIMSDCGTNFIGANNELRAALRDLNSEHLRDKVQAESIEWRFNPPAAPHMGGCWERLVRSVKNALRATLKERAPREEVLYTVLLEAELVINSRPLAYVTSDHDEPTMLTPNHLLLGTASGDTRFAAFDPRDVNARQQWKRVNALAEMFWRRWVREYLPTLQRRQTWTADTVPVRVGDIVLVSDGNQPRSVWPRGKVIKVFPGSDGTIRVVDVQTCNGTLRRPVTRIAVVPTDKSVFG